jgi:hypothetical protein
LRTKDGKDFAVLDWDGVKDVIKFTPSKPGHLTNYRFLDSNDKVVAQGVLKDIYVESGYELNIKTKLMMDASSQLEVSQSFQGGVPLPRIYMRAGSAVSAGWNPPPTYTLSNAHVPAPAPIPIPTNVSAPTATVTSIKAGLESIMDLMEADIDDLSVPGQLIVTIKKYSDHIYNLKNWKSEAKLVIEDANKYLANTLPLGIGYTVNDGTPINLLDWAVSDLKIQYYIKNVTLANARDHVIDFLVSKRFDTRLPIGLALSCMTTPTKLEFKLAWHGRNFYATMTP